MRRPIHSILLSGALVIGAAGLGVAMLGAARPASRKPTSAASLFQDYKSWRRANPKPFRVDAPTYQLCASAPAPGSAWTSPHTGGFITVYANPVGEQPLLRDAHPSFPVGTILVKEKRPQAAALKPELLTVMEKKPKGFDPKHGDWEYSVYNVDGKRATDTVVKNCQICHERVKNTDYVFREYLPEQARKSFR